MKRKPGLYYVGIWRGVDVSVSGPFKNDGARVRAARRRFCSWGQDSTFARLDITRAGRPRVSAFTFEEIEGGPV